jgi:hypothetical protein
MNEKIIDSNLFKPSEKLNIFDDVIKKRNMLLMDGKKISKW